MNDESNDLRGKMEDLLEQLRKLSLTEVADFLTERMRMVAQSFFELAGALRIFQEKGGDVDSLRLPMKTHLLKIAYAQLLPEAMEKFYFTNPGLLRRLGNLCLPDQRMVVDGSPLEVATIDAEGHITFRAMKADTLSPTDTKQVFASDHIRSREEQISWLRSQSRIDAPVVFGGITVEKNGIRVKQPMFIGEVKLISLLNEIKQHKRRRAS